jgi:hypothetical protein
VLSHASAMLTQRNAVLSISLDKKTIHAGRLVF